MYRKYESCFGAAPFYCAILWYELGLSYFDHGAPTAHVQPKHLLMALHFLKAYNTEDRSTIFHRCDAKTLRQWVWYMLKGIASLDVKFVRALLSSLLSFLLDALGASSQHEHCAPSMSSIIFCADSMGEPASELCWEQGYCLCRRHPLQDPRAIPILQILVLSQAWRFCCFIRTCHLHCHR